MKIIVGSTNPIKSLAVKETFIEYLNTYVSVIEFSPKISVSNTPSSIDEMIKGAKERATISLDKYSDNNFGYGVGIESGLFKTNGSYFLTAYAAIVNKHGEIGIGGGPVLKLPASWKFKSETNFFEYGDYVDKLSNETNIEQKQGAMGYLTDHKLVRKDSLKLALLCAYYALKNDSDSKVD
jgi:inosine/xanthosine triphosphatase